MRSEEFGGTGRTVRAIDGDDGVFTRRRFSGRGRGRTVVELKGERGDSGNGMEEKGNRGTVAGQKIRREGYGKEGDS